MAERTIIVQPALCFMLKRYGKTDISRLKTVTVNFFSPELIAEAKEMLTSDMEKMGIDNIPHIAKRRDGKDRCSKEVDDILAIIKVLDEQKSFDKLSHYVVDDPASLPTMNIVDGDMYIILNKLAQLENSLSMVQYGIHSLHSIVHTMQQSVVNSGGPGHGHGPATSSAKNSAVGKPFPAIQQTAAAASAVSSKQPIQQHVANTAVTAVSAVTGSSNLWSALTELQSQSGYEASGDEQQNDAPFVLRCPV